jgi:hypothetical protein
MTMTKTAEQLLERRARLRHNLARDGHRYTPSTKREVLAEINEISERLRLLRGEG